MIPSLPSPRTLLRAPAALALAAALCLPTLARAGSDDPIPYPDDEDQSGGLRQLPRRSDASPNVRPETDVEKQDREVSLAHLDDPNVGLAFEGLVGAMLIQSSRGQWVEGRLGYGGRFTWEFGRTFSSDDVWREALFADVTYAYAVLHDGTSQIYDDSNYHYLTLAPAYQFPFGAGSPYGFYFQLGGGAAYEYTVLHAGLTATPVVGLKPVIQYGAGLRGSPRLFEGAPFRVSFRLELTRLHRGYEDDTFLGGSFGIAF